MRDDFPLQKTPRCARLAGGQIISMCGKAKILVVDDQMAVVMMTVFLLTRAGFQAEAALNVQQALQRAQTEPFDLITLDIGMPDINGFDLFRRLRQIPHLKDTPVIFVTGCATIENQQRALELGAADVIEKPFEARDFIARVLSCIKPAHRLSDSPNAQVNTKRQKLCPVP